MTPDIVPFWHGHSYLPLLTKPIPRLLWASKPVDDIGQEFPHRYDLLERKDDSTSFKLYQLLEAYINFGTVGVVLVMFLIGMIYRSIILLLIHPDMGAGGIIAISYIGMLFLDIESNFSLLFGGEIQLFLLFSFACLLVAFFERCSN
jgi:hypothetical protein